MSTNEKRCEKRFPLTAPVGVKIQSCPSHHDLEGARIPGTTSDLSMNGIRLQLDRVLPVNTFLEMEVSLSRQIFLLCGRVIWIKSVGQNAVQAGVMFTSEDETRLSSWKRALSRVLLGEE